MSLKDLKFEGSTYKEFVDQVARDIGQLIDEPMGGVDVKSERVKKSTESYYGISVRPHNSEVGMCQNMTEYYKRLENGREYIMVLADVAVDLLSCWEDAPPFQTEMLENYRLVRDKLFVTAMPIPSHEEMLKDVPHLEIGDIAGVFRFITFTPSGEAYTTLITNDLLKNYRISKSKLIADALANASKRFPAKVLSMEEFLGEKYARIEQLDAELERMEAAQDKAAAQDKTAAQDKEDVQDEEAAQDKEDVQDEDKLIRSILAEDTDFEESLECSNLEEYADDPKDTTSSKTKSKSEFDKEYEEDFRKTLEDANPMYLASCGGGIRGAGCLFYPDFLKQAAEKIGGSYYIIPSSTSELILIPFNALLSPDALKANIKEVNDTQVALNEILSYSLYFYDSKADEIRMV